LREHQRKVIATMHSDCRHQGKGRVRLVGELVRYVEAPGIPRGLGPAAAKSSKPRKNTSTAAKSIEGRRRGRLTDIATRKGEAPALRAASSTSLPRLFRAAEAYTYTLGTWVNPAITVIAAIE
jgi:hypothetical protein